jgi:hypothetical protein
MVRLSRFVIALCGFSMVVCAQDDPLAWFPLQVGVRRVYEHEWKSGNRSRPNVDRWTTEEAITAWIAISEGLVVLREVKQLADANDQAVAGRVMDLNGQLHEVQRQNHPNGGYLVTREREPYLVHRNCVYVIDDGFNAQTRQLRASYRKDLAEGAVSPDFCFPLEMGREWGNTDIPWRVEPLRKGEGSFLPADYVGAIHIFSDHFGSGGLKDVWFKKGVGVVEEHYIHNGSYDEYTKKLVSFLR